MAEIGRCLLFYLKYAAEMERLYELDEPRVDGLPNPDRVLERIRHVGDTAGREGAELLEACALDIDHHFRAISAIRRTRRNLEKNWELEFRVSPRTGPDNRFRIGVTVDPDRAALVPWVWCGRSRRAEDEIVQLLGRGYLNSVSAAHLGA